MDPADTCLACLSTALGDVTETFAEVGGDKPALLLLRSLVLESRLLLLVDILMLRLRCFRPRLLSSSLDDGCFDTNMPNWSISNSSELRFFALRAEEA